MKTVRDACQLQPNALSVKLSDQIEQLDELISAEGNGTAFFDRTFITQGMKDLITEGIARLAGASSQAVLHLKQAMGGGKTHLLVGFGLLARHAALRAKAVVLNGYVQDSTCDTWETLADAVYAGGSAAIKKKGWPLPGQVKHEWAERIGPRMVLDRNVSPSFCKFRDGLR